MRTPKRTLTVLSILLVGLLACGCQAVIDRLFKYERPDCEADPVDCHFKKKKPDPPGRWNAGNLPKANFTGATCK